MFLSYARADRLRVGQIVEALTAAGYEVWWDALIDAGAAYAKLIESRLDSATAVVVAWSKASVDSDWVRDEAGRGRDRRRLAPISLDGTPPPLGFRQYHAIDFSGWSGERGAPQMAALVRALDRVDSAEPHPAAATGRGAVDRRLVIRVAAGAGVVAAAVGAAAVWRLANPPRPDASIAVLPFKNLSGDAGQAYFSDGLSEEVRSALIRNPHLRVAAPTSSNLFRAPKTDAKAIGGKLGVAYLLEGSVRRSADLVRIAAELIDTRSGFTTWSATFDRKLNDVLALQSEIAGNVADALAVRIGGSAPAPGATTSVAAFDAYLRGRALFNADAGESSDRAALAQFDAAIATDPNYAAAHAARSRSLAAIAAQYATAAALRGLYDQAIDAARRAVRIAPNLGNAQLALAYATYTGRLDLRAARAPFDRAYRLGKGDADILVLFAFFCARTRRAPEALAAVNLAVALDPLNPRAHRALGSVLYTANLYAQAIPPLQRALAMNPAIANAHALIGQALYMQGRYAEARDAFAAEPHLSFKLAGLAAVERRLGDPAAARAAMARLVSELGDSALYQQAQVLAQWGDKAGAIAALRRARAASDSGLVSLGADPLLAPLHAEPGYSELLSAIGWA